MWVSATSMGSNFRCYLSIPSYSSIDISIRENTSYISRGEVNNLRGGILYSGCNMSKACASGDCAPASTTPT